MTEPNLFNQDDNDNTPLDPAKNYFEELVGEGKKFKTPEDLAKGKYLADSYVNTLEHRLDAAREQIETLLNESKARPRLEELLDRLATQQQPTSSRTEPETNEDTNRPNLTPEDIESLVANTIAKRDATNREQENYDTVLAKVRERYGNGYKEVLKSQAEQLGMTDEEVNLMARKNPKLFAQTFDLNTQPSRDIFQSPPTSNRRPDTFTPRTEKRNWAYYEKLRKANPRAWLDPKTAVQMDKDAQEQGQDFYR